MENDTIQKEAISSWVNRSELEKVLSIGLYGPPELKRDEKMHYLGDFKERVIKILTKKQVMEPGIYPEIVKALADERAVKMVINGEIPSSFTRKYEKLAKSMGKAVTSTCDPEFKGDTGLIVASNDAVEAKDITVRDRGTKLKNLGVPVSIINSAEKKLCDRCLREILDADPEESINYRKISSLDRFWGERCPACQKH